MFLCFISFYTGKNACNIVSNAVDRGYKTIESSSLASLQCSNSDSRPDILIEVQQTYRIQMMGLTVISLWVLEHIGLPCKAAGFTRSQDHARNHLVWLKLCAACVRTTGGSYQSVSRIQQPHTVRW